MWTPVLDDAEDPGGVKDDEPRPYASTAGAEGWGHTRTEGSRTVDASSSGAPATGGSLQPMPWERFRRGAGLGSSGSDNAPRHAARFRAFDAEEEEEEEGGGKRKGEPRKRSVTAAATNSTAVVPGKAQAQPVQRPRAPGGGGSDRRRRGGKGGRGKDKGSDEGEDADVTDDDFV